MNVTNNSYAMGGQPVGETMGNKGVARFGMAINPEQMHAERVNGQNVLAVIEQQVRKNKLAIDGEGPIITELMTYRFEGHSSADGVQPYREKSEIEE
jgi:2-oxoisovalerate dehydrogenase E1 component